MPTHVSSTADYCRHIKKTINTKTLYPLAELNYSSANGYFLYKQFL